MNEDNIFIRTQSLSLLLLLRCFYIYDTIYYLGHLQVKASRAPIRQNALCVFGWMNRKVSVCFGSWVGRVFFVFFLRMIVTRSTVCSWHSERGSGAVKLTIHFSHTTRRKLSCFLPSQYVSELRRKCIFSTISSRRSQGWNKLRKKKHKSRDAWMYSQRAWASAPIVLCRPARRTRWSPTLPPLERERMNGGMQLSFIYYWFW